MSSSTLSHGALKLSIVLAMGLLGKGKGGIFLFRNLTTFLRGAFIELDEPPIEERRFEDAERRD